MAMKDIEPKTRIEYFLNKIADGGGSGGGGDSNVVMNFDRIPDYMFDGEILNGFWYRDENGTTTYMECASDSINTRLKTASFHSTDNLPPAIISYSYPKTIDGIVYGIIDNITPAWTVIHMYPVDLSVLSTERVGLTSNAIAGIASCETKEPTPDGAPQGTKVFLCVNLISDNATFAYGEYEGGDL